MSVVWDDERVAFADAAAWLVELTAAVGDRWEQPGLGQWDVRALVGHTSRALMTVETALDRPAAAAELSNRAAYYAAARALVAGPEVSERGRLAGQALGADPPGAVRALVERVLPRVATADGSELVTTVVGGMRFRDYLPTRVFELAVHGADLASALGLPSEVPPRPAVSSLRTAADLAVASGQAATVLRAVTGRTGLPSGFSLL
jgi:hypothetical protein